VLKNPQPTAGTDDRILHHAKERVRLGVIHQGKRFTGMKKIKGMLN
jgi:hypothetical protein